MCHGQNCSSSLELDTVWADMRTEIGDDLQNHMGLVKKEEEEERVLIVVGFTTHGWILASG